ncbi:MAG: hypothetical protein PHP63_04605 [Candidatus Marinimicrobia bacterium]|nr:hypothetical protein [Candidatus Neomarinimicrobiota bacterium]
MPVPYTRSFFQFNDPVEMIGHHDKFINCTIREMAGDIFQHLSRCRALRSPD